MTPRTLSITLLFGSLALAFACGGSSEVAPTEVPPIGSTTSTVAPPVASSTAEAPPAAPPKAAGESPDAKESRCSDEWSSCRSSCGDNSDCFMKCPHCSGCVEGEDCDTCPAREEACMSECSAGIDTCHTECDHGLDRCRG